MNISKYIGAITRAIFNGRHIDLLTADAELGRLIYTLVNMHYIEDAELQLTRVVLRRNWVITWHSGLQEHKLHDDAGSLRAQGTYKHCLDTYEEMIKKYREQS